MGERGGKEGVREGGERGGMRDISHIPASQVFIVGEYLLSQFIDKLVEAEVDLRLHLQQRNIVGVVKPMDRPGCYNN